MTETISVPEFEAFDWSDGHGVTPLEAEQVFFNTPLFAGADIAHSQKESRFYVLGQTDEGKELFVAFTMRGRRLRVVSARDMSRKERRFYRS